MGFFKRHIFIKNVLIILIILIILFILVNYFLSSVTRHNKELIVPDFSEMTVSEAQVIAEENSLRLDVTDSAYINNMGRGLIFRQNPSAGSHVKKNRRILLTINAVNPQMTAMPSLTGFSLRQAKTELLSKGLSLGKLKYVEDMATNYVLAQEYKGKKIAPGTPVETESVIDLVLGMNVNDTTTFIPNVMGYRYSIAKDILNDNSLNIGTVVYDESVTNYSDSIKAVVFRISPEPSDSTRYDIGSEVSLSLTMDKTKIPVDTCSVTKK